jgi:hypothetical protein
MKAKNRNITSSKNVEYDIEDNVPEEVGLEVIPDSNINLRMEAFIDDMTNEQASVVATSTNMTKDKVDENESSNVISQKDIEEVTQNTINDEVLSGIPDKNIDTIMQELSVTTMEGNTEVEKQVNEEDTTNERNTMKTGEVTCEVSTVTQPTQETNISDKGNSGGEKRRENITDNNKSSRCDFNNTQEKTQLMKKQVIES